ncbi:TonB-dependent receptor plug domain-containing protein [Chitinimonas naiadis]
MVKQAPWWLWVLITSLCWGQDQPGSNHRTQTAPEEHEARAQGGEATLWLDDEPLPERALKWFSTLPGIWFDSVLVPLADSGASVLNLRLTRTPAESASQESSFEAGSSDGRPTARLGLSRTAKGSNWQDKLITDLAWREEPLSWSKATHFFDPAGYAAGQEQEDVEEHRRSFNYRLAPSFEIPDGQGIWTFTPFLAHSSELNDRLLRRATTQPDQATALLVGRQTEHARNTLWRSSVTWAGPYGGWKHRASLLLQGSIDQSELLREDTDPWGLRLRLRKEEDSGQDRDSKLSLESARRWVAHAFSLGGEWREIRSKEQEAVHEQGELPSLERYAQLEYRTSLWLKDDWQVRPEQRLSLGLRGNHIDTRPTYPEQIARRYFNLLPSGAWRWQADADTVVRLGINRSIRLPKVSELSTVRDNVPDNDSLNPDLIGNPQLRPERSWTGEAGLERKLAAERGQLNAQFSVREIKDLIEDRNLLSQGRWVEVPYNIEHARTWTLKLGSRLNLARLGWQGATLDISASHIGSSVSDPTTGRKRHIFDQPADLFSLSLASPVPGGWRGKFDWHYAARVEKGGPGGSWYESGQHTVDVSLSRPEGRDGRWQISLRDLLPEQLRTDQPEYQDGRLYSRTRLKETAASQLSIAYIQKW